MKKSVYVIFFGSLFLVNFARASQAPVLAKEEIEYISRQENELLALNKSKEFIGVMARLKVAETPAKHIEGYYFKDMKALKSDPHLCKVVAERIFGPEDGITLKKTAAESLPSASAVKICCVVMMDPGSHAIIKERHLFVKVLHAKVYAFVFRFPKVPSPEELQDAHHFIEGLR